MSRKLKITLAVVALLVLALGSIPFWIDGAARSAVETSATDALGVPTTLDKLSLSLFGGEAELSQLRIKNPAGYDGDFFSLKDGHVSVTYGSLMGDTVEIPELTLDGIELNLIKRRKESNYDKILDNMTGGSGGGGNEKEKEGGGGGPEPASDGGDDSAGKKFVIRRIIVKNIRVKATVRMLGDVESEMEIEELVFENIGSDTDGAQFTGIIREFIGKMLFSVVTQGGGILPPEITKGLGKGVEGLGNIAKTGIKVIGKGGKAVLKEGGKALEKTGKTALEGGKKVVEGAGDALKNLGGAFKKKKKKKDE